MPVPFGDTHGLGSCPSASLDTKRKRNSHLGSLRATVRGVKGLPAPPPSLCLVSSALAVTRWQVVFDISVFSECHPVLVFDIAVEGSQGVFAYVGGGGGLFKYSASTALVFNSSKY